MSIFELAGKITIDKSGFDSGISHAENAAKAFGEKFDKIAGGVKKALTAAFSIAAVTKLTRAVIDLANETSAYGDTIDKQSQVLGMTRKGYQEWNYILGQNGISIDSMSGAMRALNNSMMSAVEGSEESTNAFAQLGLHIQELEKLSPEQQFEEVVRALQKMPAGAEKSALAMKLLGRGGMSLMPLLNSESATIDELRQRAYELGIIMSDDAVDASVAYGDAMDDLKKTFTGIKYAMGAQLLPTFTKAVQTLTNYAAKISRAYQENGLKGVWDTIVADFKTIKWPTWDDVSNAIQTAWSTIVEGVKGLGGLVFGENSDGTVNWPNWDDVLKFGKGLWDSLVSYVADLGGMIFGRNEEGEVNWPTLEDIWAWADHLWAQVVSYVNDFGGLVFGLNDDGSVAWPDINELIASFDTWWTDTALPALQGAMTWTLTLFGVPTETAEQIASVIGGWWDTVVKQAEGVLKWVMGLPETPPHEAGEQLRALLEGWWNGIKDLFTGIFDLFFGTPKPSDEEGTSTKNNIVGWWIAKVKPLLVGALDFTLGLFGLPDVEEMKKKIIDWWEDVKRAVGELVLNITSFIQGTPTQGTFTVGDTVYQDPMGAFKPQAKGLWDVPYDGFPAILHRHERVLTASQARRKENNIDLSGLGSEITQSIRAGMEGVTVRSYLNGRDVTREVNKDLTRQVKARRFAT